MCRVIIVVSIVTLFHFVESDISFSGCEISERQCITCTQPRLVSVPAYGRYLRQLPALYVRAVSLS
jgi:hypothetical protein